MIFESLVPTSLQEAPEAGIALGKLRVKKVVWVKDCEIGEWL